MSSNSSRGTIKCRKPFLRQIEQLHSVTRARSAVTRKRTRPQWHPPAMVLGFASLPSLCPAAASVIAFLSEQPELGGIACRLGEAEMTKRMRGEQPAARGALDEAFLDQERL